MKEKKLNLKARYCPDCGSDDLSLYASGETEKPTYAACNKCELESKIEEKDQEIKKLKEALKTVLEYDDGMCHVLESEGFELDAIINGGGE